MERKKNKNEFDEVEHKLLLLYLIENIGLPTPSNIIEEFILGSNYMDYFNLNSNLADLLDRDFIEKFSSDNISKYCITDEGKKMLETLETQIPNVVRTKIDNYIAENKKNIKFSMEVSANIYENEANQEFIVRCKAYDDIHMLMELNIMTTSHKEARNIRNNWISNVGVIYDKIMMEISKETEE